MAVLIDVESIVFTKVAEALQESSDHPNIFLSGEYVREPPSFPAVFVEMADDFVDKSMTDSGGVENGARVLFEVNVFSNKPVGAKSEAKSVASAVDSTLAGMGFSRTMMQPVPNPGDLSVYRLVLRYEAGVTASREVYR